MDLIIEMVLFIIQLMVPPYKSIVLTPGFGGGSSEMSSWDASHGFVAMRIGPNDEM